MIGDYIRYGGDLISGEVHRKPITLQEAEEAMKKMREAYPELTEFYNTQLGIPYQPHKRMHRMNSPTLENWSVVGSGNPYTAPERQRQRLAGTVTGHPDIEDGEGIRTSSIQEVQGRCVRTHNRWYNLGDPCPEYVEWCKAHGRHVPTWDEPIKVKDGQKTDAESGE
jgi:hypothetical protein